MTITTRTLAAVVAAALIVLSSPARAGIDVQVNQLDPANTVQNETSLVVNPTSPNNIVMAYNDHPYAGLCPGLGISFSYDFGVSWQDRQLPIPTGLVDAFDPITGVDTFGTVYAGYIATDGNSPGNSGLFVWQSFDGGNSWPPIFMGTATFTVNGFLNDKPHMVVDDFLCSPFVDRVHVAWIQDLPPTQSDIWYAYSTSPPQVALTFSQPQMISSPATGNRQANGPNIAVAFDGTVYVAWLDVDVTVQTPRPGTLYMDSSSDGGLTWGPDLPVQVTPAPPYQITCVRRRFRDIQAPQGLDVRAHSYPCIEVSQVSSSEVFLVYTEDVGGGSVNNEADVFFIKTLDGGQTWLPPVLLSEDVFGQPRSGPQWAPWIDVKPNGTIDVAWYEGGFIDPGFIQWGVVMRSSTDGGFTWSPPVLVSDQIVPAPVEPIGQTRWLGEYLALVVDSTFAHIGFTSSVSDGAGDVYYDRIENTGQPCAGDVNIDGHVDVDDLTMIILFWGVCPPCMHCPADTNDDGTVDVDDLTNVILTWGPC